MVLACVIGLVLPPGATATVAAEREFHSEVRRLAKAEKVAMKPRVWRKGCPVPLRRLRMVTASHWNFEKGVGEGQLVVHRSVARDTVGLLQDFFDLRFPIRRMRPIRFYAGSDFASIEADNTSAFNCRRVTGGSGWSRHAYGRAIDINPLENPYVLRGRTEHTGSRPFLRRAVERPGMLNPASPAVVALESRGWNWGGRWTVGPVDYQHISMPSRRR